jgi:AraC-like DNA-binding protein
MAFFIKGRKMKFGQVPFSIKLFGYFILLGGFSVTALSVLNYVFTLSFYREHLGQSYLERLKTADRIFSLWNDEIKNQSLIISLNTHLPVITPEGGNSAYDLIYLTQDLSNIVRANNKYHSIFLIPGQREEIVTSLSWVVPPERKLAAFYREYTDQSPVAGWWNTSHSLSGVSGFQSDPVLTYFCPLVPYATGISGYIAFNIRESDLNRIINGDGENNSLITIVNEQGEVLSDADKGNIGSNISRFPALWNHMNNGSSQGFAVIDIEGTGYFNVFWRSSLTNWYYYLNVFMDDFNTRIRAIYVISAGLLGGFLVLISLFSLFFTKRLNRPVKSIVNRLRNNENIRLDTRTDEFNQISAVLDSFSHRLSEDAELISEYQLLRVVSGSAAVPANIFRHPLACCVLVLPEGDGGTDPSREKTEIIRRFHTRFEPPVSCFGLSQDKNSILIFLNFREPDDKTLERVVREIEAETRRESQTGFSAGLGKTTGIGEAHLSYNSARMAVSFRLLSGPGSILSWSADMDIVKGYFYPYNREKIIFNNLRLGNAEETAAALTAFCADIRDRKNISLGNVRAAFNQLMGGIIKYLLELHINSREIFGEEYQLYRNLAEFEFIDDIKNFFMMNFSKIIAFENRSGKKKDHITKIFKYLKAEEDNTFDLNVMADALGLSYSHLRRIFTDETGENILHYVYKQKVEGAKKLLLETDLTVNEIGEKKGFYNRLSFYRFFKKYEGITPGEFRELNRGQG